VHFEKLTRVHVMHIRTHRTNKSKVPYRPLTPPRNENGLTGGDGIWRLYLLIDVGEGSVGFNGGLLVRRTLAHDQKTRINDESQRRILLWQLEREQFRIVIDIRHLCQLHGT
jgi:hypothetical protein